MSSAYDLGAMSSSEPKRPTVFFNPQCSKCRTTQGILAERGIEAGLQYARAIRNRRVRTATVLPALIGTRTLALLRDAGATALRRHIKVPRGKVRAIVASLIFRFGSRSRIESLYRELSR